MPEVWVEAGKLIVLMPDDQLADWRRKFPEARIVSEAYVKMVAARRNKMRPPAANKAAV